jgi:hypothetical protein
VVLRIIGAGLPRTATLAQKIALDLLGVSPCYHMVTLLADLDRVRLWKDALEGDARWDDIFSGFCSTVDWPGSFFYAELMDAYPTAKVVLSVRDPETWATSMRATVLAANRGESLMRRLSETRAVVDPQWLAFNQLTSEMLFGRRGLLRAGDDESRLPALFQRHVDEVKATVAPGRLLVWAPADGWEPLCDFVGAPVPDTPFPHVNDAETFEERIVEGSLAVLNRYWDQRQRENARAVSSVPS